MLSIGTLAAGQADYYLDQASSRVTRAGSVGTGVEDYYAGGHEAPGYWFGAGAERLRLAGAVDREALTRVLDGSHPASAIELVGDHPRRVPGLTRRLGPEEREPAFWPGGRDAAADDSL